MGEEMLSLSHRDKETRVDRGFVDVTRVIFGV